MAEGGSKIKTPKSEATLKRDTELSIKYDPSRAKGEFKNFTGETEVVTLTGEKQELKALERVEQQGDELSELKSVLPSPRLTSPAHNQEIDFDTQREIRLAWDGVDGAQRYALNVSRGQIFADNIIEDTNRRKASARVGIRGEGDLLLAGWRPSTAEKFPRQVERDALLSHRLAQGCRGSRRHDAA